MAGGGVSALASLVTGDRYGGLGVCHGPGCGAEMPPEVYGYCSRQCRDQARRLALAGVTWKPAPAFVAAARHRINAEKPPPGRGASTRTQQRRAKQAMST